MLLDEPTSNLDLPTKKELLNIILKCKKLNKTVIVVLHDVNEAILIADKILVIDTGNIIFEGSVSDFEDRNIPQKIFGVEKFSLTDKNGAISFLYK